MCGRVELATEKTVATPGDTGRRSLLVFDLGRSDYRSALALQEDLQEGMVSGLSPLDRLLVSEHHPVFTIGKKGQRENSPTGELTAAGFDCVPVNRGGDITWHGPGQLMLYPILDLNRLGIGIREYIYKLEEVMLSTAQDLGVEARRDGRNAGIWAGDAKLGSIGVAVRRGISIHGLALNATPDLTPFSRINPCGLAGISMTSLAAELERTARVDPCALLRNARLRLVDNFLKIFDIDGHYREETLVPNIPIAGRSIRRKPSWLRRPLPKSDGFEKVRALISRGKLHTVCQSAACPNQWECFSRNTATFLLLGPHCTRTCRFCNIDYREPATPDPEEPIRVAQAVEALGLKYAVLTSVTRDDLPDGGAGHFSATIQAIRASDKNTRVEVLIPDFLGDKEALTTVMAARPDVLNHNLETVPSLYSTARPQAIYRRSLELFQNARQIDSSVPLKSGLMLGLGETFRELQRTLDDLLAAGCSILTIGQYLQPTRDHLPVRRYYTPEEFAALEVYARGLGFAGVAAAPLVRSSYRADTLAPD